MRKKLLGYRETSTWLRKAGINQAQGGLVETPQAALELAEKIGYPIVLKLVSPKATHKSDMNLVRLSLGNPNEVKSVSAELLKLLPPDQIEGLLVQKMVEGGTEVLVGTVLDEQFGHVLVFGSGGVQAELWQDTRMRVLPVQRWQIIQMIEETKVYRLLQGYRGTDAGDVSDLVKLIEQVTCLVELQSSELVSLDLNPVIVQPNGVSVVDARIIVRKDLNEKPDS